MKTGEILPEMVAHRSVGMRYGDIFQRIILEQHRSVEQMFKIHHIVNDDRIFPITSFSDKIPASYRPRDRRKPLRKRQCRCMQRLEKSGFTCNPVGIAITAVHLESQVVVLCLVLQRLKLQSIADSQLLYLGIPGIFIYIP